MKQFIRRIYHSPFAIVACIFAAMLFWIATTLFMHYQRHLDVQQILKKADIAHTSKVTLGPAIGPHVVRNDEGKIIAIVQKENTLWYVIKVNQINKEQVDP